MASGSSYATDADLLLWYPQFSTVDPLLRQAVLDTNQCLFSTCAWGCNLLQGSIQLAAHTLLMQQAAANGSSGGGGPVSQMSMGPVSISYNVNSTMSDSAYGETGPGRQYMALRDMCGPQAIGANGGDCGTSPVGCGCTYGLGGW